MKPLVDSRLALDCQPDGSLRYRTCPASQKPHAALPPQRCVAGKGGERERGDQEGRKEGRKERKKEERGMMDVE